MGLSNNVEFWLVFSNSLKILVGIDIHYDAIKK